MSYNAGTQDRLHPSHVTRTSDASSYDEICINCGAVDSTGGGWRALARPCPNEPEAHKVARALDASPEFTRSTTEGSA